MADCIQTSISPKTALTYVGGGCVYVGVLVELPGSHGVHLDEGDAATTPLLLRLVDREEGFEKEVDDALGDGLGVDSQASQQVIHVTHIPKLDKGIDDIWILSRHDSAKLQLHLTSKCVFSVDSKITFSLPSENADYSTSHLF